MANDYYVYILQRADGTPFYVGKGRGVRIETTRDPRKCTNHYKRHIINILLNTIGYVPYTLEREDISNEEAISEEIRIIAHYGRFPHGPLVNMTDGGDGVTRLTPDVHERRRQRMIGNKNAVGTVQSVETREKQRKAKLGNTWNRGREKSPEHLAKIAEAGARWRSTDAGKAALASLGELTRERHRRNRERRLAAAAE